MNPLTARLVTKANATQAWLQFYGAYVPDAIRDAVLAAGWRVSDLAPLVPLPEQYLTPDTKTDAFAPPKGNGPWGWLTEAEAKAAQTRLRAALKKHGILLGRGVTTLTFADMI